MPNDPEALKERLRLAREAKKAKAAELATAEPAGDDPIAELMGALQAVRNKKNAGTKALEELGAILDKIDPHEYPDLADNPMIEAFLDKIGDARLKKAAKGKLPPGTVIGDGMAARDVQWSLNDINLKPDGTKELVTWTPAETIPIFYNGVMCQCIADVEITTEKAFYDIYSEHRRLMREGEVRKRWMFGKTNERPPESDEAAVSMARVRAFMGMGGEGGGGRILTGYPGDARFELRDVPGATPGESSGETAQ